MEFKHNIEAREHEVLCELQALARPHVEASDGLFTLLPVDTENYPAQSLKTASIDGSPQDVGTVRVIAQAVERRFDQFTDKLDELEESDGEISRLGEMLRAGNNIILVTNHSDIKDIAYTLAAYYIKLKEKDFDFHSSLVISKIVSFLGVGLGGHADPATNLLKNICDKEYLSFPRTKTIAESRIGTQIVDTYNGLVRQSMKHQLRHGGNLFAMAPSGTTDKPDPENPATTLLGAVGNGTAKLMMSDRSLVAPVATWITEDEIVFEPCDVPRAVNSIDEAHSLMDDIALHLSRRVEGRQFRYAGPDIEKSIGATALS